MTPIFKQKGFCLGPFLGRIARMQKITSLSKYLILAVVSFTFLMPLDIGLFDVTGSGSVYAPAQTQNESLATDSITATDQSGNVLLVDSVWNSMSRDFRLDHKVETAQVQAEIRKLLAERDKLYSILQAAGPYIYFIHQQTQARNLPGELALIPVIESEFNPNDHSRKGATGLWQLMRQTAHELGVKVKEGYDGRRDVIASTKAALAYFNDLGNCFNGNWYLAIAAYNCGQGRILSAIKHGGTRSFWNLRLPHETKVYVPKLLAVAAIVANPEKYNVKLPPITDKPYFAEVKTTKPVDLTRVAKTTGINVETLHTLNPDYKHAPVPKKEKGYSILVPVNLEPRVRAQLGDKILG